MTQSVFNRHKRPVGYGQNKRHTHTGVHQFVLLCSPFYIFFLRLAQDLQNIHRTSPLFSSLILYLNLKFTFCLTVSVLIFLEDNFFIDGRPGPRLPVFVLYCDQTTKTQVYTGETLLSVRGGSESEEQTLSFTHLRSTKKVRT